MTKAIFAVMAGSQVKIMGVVGGVSLLINHFRRELSLWLSSALDHAVRPEILDILFSLATIAMIGTVLVSFVLYIFKSFTRIRKTNRVADALVTAHMQTVASLSEALGAKSQSESQEAQVKIRQSLSALVDEVERLQKKSKRIRARDPELAAAYEDYVHKLTVFSAAAAGARISDEEPLAPNLKEATEAIYHFLNVASYVEKGRRFRKKQKRTLAMAEDVDAKLSLSTSFAAPQAALEAAAAPEELPEAEGPASVIPPRKETPDVIVRAQTAREGKRLTRREKRKLGPMDQPEKVLAARRPQAGDES